MSLTIALKAGERRFGLGFVFPDAEKLDPATILNDTVSSRSAIDFVPCAER